jgi:hypothetical protein
MVASEAFKLGFQRWRNARLIFENGNDDEVRAKRACQNLRWPENSLSRLRAIERDENGSMDLHVYPFRSQQRAGIGL